MVVTVNSRREFLKVAPAAAVGLTTGLAGCAGPQPGAIERPGAGDRPNIVLIVTDDQGYGDVGFHGNAIVETPNMNRLADQSVECTHFYASAVCAPTRASLMTGRYHYRTGVNHTSRGGAKMHTDELTLAEVLSAAGYATGIFGKWHLGDNYPLRPVDQGFDESLVHTAGGLCQTPDLPNDYFNPKLWQNGQPVEVDGYCADIFADAALEFIDRQRQRPFFVYLAFNTPHTPLIVGDEYSEPYRANGHPPDLSRLYGMITNIDDNIGYLRAELERTGEMENTILIFMGDNGPGGGVRRYNAGLRAGKGSVYDGGLRVPFLIRWPGRWDDGTVPEPTAPIDVFPTLLDACRIELPSDREIDGRSLVPRLDGRSAPSDDRVLMFQWHRGMEPRLYQNAAVRTRRYKLVSHPGLTAEQTSEALPLEPDFELYDMVRDPEETTNIAGKRPDLVEDFHQRYVAWFEDVRSSRNFEPGIIHIGSPHEHPVHLCRYQDASYVGGVPQGWPVTIEREGRYVIAIDRTGYMDAGTLHLSFAGDEFSESLPAGVHRSEFYLPAGKGMLDVWLELEDRGRITFTENHTLGDVDIMWRQSSHDSG